MKKEFNIIFIVGDALRLDKLGCYGYKKPTSPVIDKLAAKSIIFRNAFSCSNHTDSSITSMMTGKYPITHGILHHGKRVNESEVRTLNNTETKMLPEILKSCGYATFGLDWLGRWHKRGYDYYGERGPYDTKESELEKKIDELPDTEDMKRRLKIMLHKVGFHLPGRSGVYYTRQAIRFIKNRPDKKFFLFIHNWDTHTPFDILPDEYKNKFYDGKGKKKVTTMLKKIKDKKWKKIVRDYHLFGVEYLEEADALYDAGVNLFDNSIKELLECLKEEKLLENTIIVITADHGDNPIYNGTFVGHFGLYEPVIHVPLILYAPKLVKGKTVRNFVQHVDLVPTLLDLINIDYDEYNPDGKSLVGLIKGKINKTRNSVLISDGAASWRFAIRTKKFKYIYAPASNKKVIPFDTIGNRYNEELYDLVNDPGERKNLVNREKDKVKELNGELTKVINELEDKKLDLTKKSQERLKIQRALRSNKLQI